MSYIKGLRQAQGLPPVRVKVVKPLPQVIAPQNPPFTPKRAAYLITRRPENRQPEEAELLELVVQQHPDLALIVELADIFLELLRKQQVDGFDDWLVGTSINSKSGQITNEIPGVPAAVFSRSGDFSRNPGENASLAHQSLEGFREGAIG